MTPKDEILYRNYINGDKDAATPLVSKYGDMLTMYINKYINDIDEAEDLMIETFSRIFAKARPIKGEGSFKAYLFKIARNLALRYRKKHNISIVAFEELSSEPHSDVFADNELLLGERKEELYSAMKKLKQEYWEALYIVYFEDMSYKEAAKIMGKNEQQVTKLIYRGKQKLKQLLEKEGFVYADN